jgi:glycosyltransferase involved in cell wall biosynthesis
MNQLSTMTKILEYLAFQQPIVSFDLLESRRSAGDAALYVEREDPKLFAEAILELLVDPVRRKRMGQVGLDRSENLISWNQSRAALLEAYSRLSGYPVEPLYVSEKTPVALGKSSAR